MGKRRVLEVRQFVSLNGRNGDYKPIEELTEEELDYFRQKVNEKLSRYMSDYYTQHPDEFASLVERRQRERGAIG
ncbi:MAG: hypothetical protein IJ737_06935 [Ruminococcus sp.]|nr:hypothetical protein [Ruminococcus sp.]